MPGALVLSRDERTYINKLDTKKGSRATENYRASTQVLQVNRCSQGTHKKPPQSCEERKLGCARHSINKFILCTRLHELSRAISAFKGHPALKLQWCIFSRVSLNRYASVGLPLLVISRTAAGSNSKKGTGTDKITANSRSNSGKGQMLFERCSSCCCYCVKSEFFCPRCLNEKLFATNNRRTKDVACDS